MSLTASTYSLGRSTTAVRPRALTVVVLLLGIFAAAVASGGDRGVLEAPLAAAVGGQKAMASLVDVGYRVRDERVQVVVETPSPDELAAWLEGRGAEHVLLGHRAVQAWVDASTLAELADHHGVGIVRRPDYVIVPDPAG